MVKFKLLETTKPQKSCLTCKYREFDIYGWCCNKHNKYFVQDHLEREYLAIK